MKESAVSITGNLKGLLYGGNWFPQTGVAKQLPNVNACISLSELSIPKNRLIPAISKLLITIVVNPEEQLFPRLFIAVIILGEHKQDEPTFQTNY